MNESGKENATPMQDDPLVLALKRDGLITNNDFKLTVENGKIMLNDKALSDEENAKYSSLIQQK
jgi:hypothetical protein